MKPGRRDNNPAGGYRTTPEEAEAIQRENSDFRAKIAHLAEEARQAIQRGEIPTPEALEAYYTIRPEARPDNIEHAAWNATGADNLSSPGTGRSTHRSSGQD